MKRLGLHHYILGGIVLGVLAGLALHGAEGAVATFFDRLFDTLGEIFLDLLMSVMIPLVLASLIFACLSVGDPRKLGRIGGKSLGWYLFSAALAVFTALVLAAAVKPARFVSDETKAKLQADYAAEAERRAAAVADVREEFTVWSFLKRLVPRNPIQAMTENPPDMLGLIVFGVLLGVAASLLSDRLRAPFQDFVTSFNQVLLQLVGLIMYAAPVGAFALMARVVSKSGVGILLTLLAYALTVLGAMAIHFFGFYAFTVRGLAKMRLKRFWGGLKEVMLTGFSTSSSAATLGVNFKAVADLGVPPPIANFCLSLGATVNMDGTAIFQAVAALFIADVYGVPLDAGQMAFVWFTAVLASIGTAPIPGAGIVMLGVIMTPLGIPLEGIALILGVDRFLDMSRTVVNVAGDAACAVWVARTEGELKA